MTYYTKTCNIGRVQNSLGQSLGWNAELASCTQTVPTGKYVSTLCGAGDGKSNTIFNSCTSTNPSPAPGKTASDYYVSEKCSAGSAVALGSQTKYALCSNTPTVVTGTPANNQYISQNCISGSYNTIGSNTQYSFTPCTKTGFTGTAGICTCTSGYGGTVIYHSSTDTSGCIPCSSSPGYTSSTPGSCICAAGYKGTATYSNVLGGCQVCPPGYTSTAGQTACELKCPAGSVCNGNDVQQPCPAGFICAEG